MAKKLILSTLVASVAAETLDALFWTETNEK